MASDGNLTDNFDLCCVETLNLMIKRLESKADINQADIELLKSSLITVLQIPRSDPEWRSSVKYFDILLNVLKFSGLLLRRKENLECKSDNNQGVCCDIYQMTLLKLLEHDEKCFEEVEDLLRSCVKLFANMGKGDWFQETKEHALRVIKTTSFVLDVVTTVKSVTSDLFQKYIQSHIVDLSETLEKILKHADNTITAHIMIYIFPKLYLVVDNKFNILSAIWTTVCSLFEIQSSGCLLEVHSTGYLIICSLSEIYFPVETSKSLLLLHKDELFWRIMQHGIVHTNSVSRKRSLFILKKVFHWCDLRHEKIHNDENCLFNWNWSDPDQREVWEDLTILLETLEEKQTHVIKPLLSKIDNLIKATKKNAESVYLHPSWVMIVFNRMFHHESRYVVKWALSYFLNLNFEMYPHLLEHVEKYLPVLFKILNDASLYHRHHSHPVGSCSVLALEIEKFLKTSYDVLGSTEKQLNNSGTCSVLSFKFYLKADWRKLWKIKSKAPLSLWKVYINIKEMVPFIYTHFFNSVLTCIHQQSWGGVSLFYISHALSEVSSKPLWDETAIDKIRELILNSLRTQDLLLRGAIQCYLLKCFLHLMNVEVLTFDKLSKLLIALKGNESLHRGTVIWKDTVMWLSRLLTQSSLLTVQNAKEFCFLTLNNSLCWKIDDRADKLFFVETVTSGRMARLIILLADSFHIINETQSNRIQETFILDELLKPVISILATIETRPYLSKECVNFCLDFLTCLLTEAHVEKLESVNYNEISNIKEVIIGLLCPYSNEILHFISKQILQCFTQLSNIDNLTVYLKALEILLQEENFHCSWSVIEIYVEMCSKFLLAEQTTDNVINYLCSWRYLVHVWQKLRSLPVSVINVQKIMLNIMEAYILADTIGKPIVKPEIQNDRITQAAWRYLSSSAESDMWRCIEFYLSTTPKKIDILYFSKQIVPTLDVSFPETTIPLLHCLKYIIPEVCEDETLFIAILKRSWKACLELKKNEKFKIAVEAFISMAYSDVTMTCPSYKHLHQYSLLLIELSESSPFAFAYLIEHCTKIWISCLKCSFKHMNILCKALIFGFIHRKEQRITNDAIAYIAKCCTVSVVNQKIQLRYATASTVRVIAINFLRMLSLSVKEHKLLAYQLVSLLVKEDEKISSTKLRHFGNSLVHRTKTRIWQSIILLEQLLSQEHCQELLETVYCLLIDENHQPSVRYLLEWTATRALLHYPQLQQEFFNYFHKAIQKRVGSIISFMSIIAHLGSVMPHANLENYILTWTPLIIPWSMGQNFNARIYAQLVLTKFSLFANTYKFDQVLKCYGLIFCSIQAIDNGNVSKNIQKLLDDFYFKVFNPVNHYSMETVFYELPRLSSLADEEWIEPCVFEETVKNDHTSCTLYRLTSIYNSDSLLKLSNPSSWVLRTSDTVAIDEQDNSNEMSNLDNFQKKITPWKQMIPDIEALQEIQIAKKQWISDGLIVVASLIDKAPNLGGLCRTCEVFGVSEYVLGSLKYTEDKQFQNLSVSANKWISLREVKPHCLKEYLLEMRNNDYLLIGVEQTESSQRLEHFQFPKKSLLLLGNEKEGIPVELMQFLDFCVEIPQKGIIRSLNVHVSGAILIWEYARQHNLKDIS